MLQIIIWFLRLLKTDRTNVLLKKKNTILNCINQNIITRNSKLYMKLAALKNPFDKLNNNDLHYLAYRILLEEN